MITDRGCRGNPFPEETMKDFMRVISWLLIATCCGIMAGIKTYNWVTGTSDVWWWTPVVLLSCAAVLVAVTLFDGVLTFVEYEMGPPRW
jgi:TRAP-type C4-dicarboxylate transport system permease small subunit